MGFGRGYGNDIAFSGFGLTVVIQEHQFMVDSGRDDINLLGMAITEDESRNLTSDRNPFGEPWFTGPSYTESFEFEFRFQFLTEAQTRLLIALRKLQRHPSRRTPVRLYNRRKIYEEPNPRTRAHIATPTPDVHSAVPGMAYYWAQYDVELIFPPTAFELQRGPACPPDAQEFLYKGTITAKEMQMVPLSADVVDIPTQTVLTP